MHCPGVGALWACTHKHTLKCTYTLNSETKCDVLWAEKTKGLYWKMSWWYVKFKHNANKREREKKEREKTGCWGLQTRPSKFLFLVFCVDSFRSLQINLRVKVSISEFVFPLNFKMAQGSQTWLQMSKCSIMYGNWETGSYRWRWTGWPNCQDTHKRKHAYTHSYSPPPPCLQ